MRSPSDPFDVVIVGAGPCGLATAIAAKRAGLSAVVLDRGSIVSGIAGYPTNMTFFSTAEKIEIGGVPFVVAGDKPTRREALEYYRGVAGKYELDVRQYVTVGAITALSAPTAPTAISDTRERIPDIGEQTSDGGYPLSGIRYQVEAHSRTGALQTFMARAVVVATGYFGRPNTLGVPGESLPHVRHGYIDGHFAWNADVVVVGGANSAVDAALEMHRAGARVTMVHFAESLDSNVKPWVRPEIEARLAEGAIQSVFGARVTAIEPDAVVVRTSDGEQRVKAEQVYTMTGYLPETGLLEQLGVPIDPETGIPQHDPLTMATPLQGIYLAGVIASGLQANRIFIENGRDHGDLIVQHLLSTRSA